MMGRLRIIALWFVVACSATGAAQADAATTRIVSLVPSMTEIFFALGARDQVVGVSDYCKYPPEAATLPHVGGLLNPSIEQVLLLRPSLVVLYRAQEDVVAKLAQLGVRARTVSCDTTTEVIRLIRDAGAWTGRETQAERVVHELSAGLDALSRATSRLRHPSVLLVISRDATDLAGIYAAGTNSYHGELLARAGGSNVIGTVPVPTVPISKEEIIRLDPEVILDMSVGELSATGRRSNAHETVWGQLSTLRAVRTGRVHALADPHFLVPGLSAVEAARAMNRLLHPDSAGSEVPAP